MKTLLAIALVAGFGVLSNAQTPAQPVQTPAAVQPATPVVAQPAMPEKTMTMVELQKKHIDAVAALKKTHVDEIKTLRDTMKGKPQAEIKKAVEAKKAEQKVAVKALQASNKAEIAQFKKDHPMPHKKGGKHEEPAKK